MPFIGNQLSTSFQNVETQTITGDGSTAYTLNNAVADGKDLLVYINNVKQEEGSGKSYTATGTTITFSDAVASTDSCYVVFIGQAIGTVTPKDGSIVSSMLADANLEMPNTLDLNGKELILDADADTSITADTDDQIDIKIAGSDVYQITATKIDLNGKELVLDADADTSITADTDDQIDFKTGGTDRVVIDSSGKVGVNTTSPLSTFQVRNVGSENGSLRVGGSGASLGLELLYDQSGATESIIQANPTYTSTSSLLKIRVDGDGNPNHLVMDGSGNVGIGTSPSTRLHTEVSRTTNFSASDYTTWADVLVRNNTNDDTCATGIGFINDGENYTNGASGIACLSGTGDTEGNLAFIVRPNGAVSTEAMRINSTGQVLIGTTSSLYSSTQKDGLQIEGAGGGPFVIVCKNVDTSGGANQILFLDGSGNTCGEIASNATNNTTSYGTSSDYRLKENITDVTNAISTLKKLKPKTYNFISDPDNISEDGFLAHELGAVVPNAVTGEKDAMTSDKEIKPQQVDYGRLTPLLTAALQEAVAKIETLEAKVTALEAK